MTGAERVVAPAATPQAELRELVAQAGQVLYRLGLADYLGHASARVPGSDQVVVKPKHSPRVGGMHRLGGGDMIVVDLDGRLVEGEDPPPAEVFIHTEIYRARPDVSAVVHTHQNAATLMGIIEAPVLPILHVPSTFVAEPVPLWPCPLLVVSQELGADLATALGGGRFCHLQGHGIVSVAGSVQAATVGAAMLEQLAEANLRVLQTGRSPRVIPPAEIEGLRRDAAPVEGRWAYFRQLVAETST
ncbi:MAG: class II aldolase/adducin family protein [Carbonactinosporaceae bacterium]